MYCSELAMKTSSRNAMKTYVVIPVPKDQEGRDGRGKKHDTILIETIGGQHTTPVSRPNFIRPFIVNTIEWGEIQER
jgi:hypothetical protein